MAFFTAPNYLKYMYDLCCPVKLSIRNTRRIIETLAYAPLIVLGIVLLLKHFHFPDFDPLLDRKIYKIVDAYLRHPYWYLPIWNLVFETIFASVCVLDMLMHYISVYCSIYDLYVRKRVYQFRCHVFHGLIVPITTILGLYFWPLFMFPSTRKMMLPDKLNEAIPQWFFIVLHSAIFYPFLVEHTILVPVWKIQYNVHLLYLAVYWFHIVLICFFYFLYRQWLYPFFIELHIVIVCILILAGWIFGHIMIKLSVSLHNYRCREPLERRPSID